MDDETLIKYSYVAISRYRVEVVKALEGEVMIPRDISRDIGIGQNHVSKALCELKEIGITECINEEARKGRLYRLTDVGEEIARNLE